MTALQDWLNIRPLDPMVKAFICALRGVHSEDAVQTPAEPMLIRRGVERC